MSADVEETEVAWLRKMKRWLRKCEGLSDRASDGLPNKRRNQKPTSANALYVLRFPMFHQFHLWSIQNLEKWRGSDFLEDSDLLSLKKGEGVKEYSVPQKNTFQVRSLVRWRVRTEEWLGGSKIESGAPEIGLRGPLMELARPGRLLEPTITLNKVWSDEGGHPLNCGVIILYGAAVHDVDLEIK